MEFYLQYGWGMKGLCRRLATAWEQSTTILSPRDLDDDELVTLSSELRSQGGSVLLDPQFYLPRADHKRLTKHCYWPADYDTFDFAGGGCPDMVRSLVELNSRMGTAGIILPGLRADPVDDVWLAYQQAFRDAARSMSDVPLIATVCLSAEATRSSEQIGLVMTQAEQIPVSGYYLVTERPSRSFMVDDPQWVANTLDLTASLRRLGTKVIIGYSNQQQLIMACAGANAIATGTHKNVRNFTPNKFKASDGWQQRRRAVWYYDPDTFSEYPLSFLDIGFRAGLKDELLSSQQMSLDVSMLDVPQPSASGWNLSNAGVHFLTVLRAQARSVVKDTFDETVRAYRMLLDLAENKLERYHQHGVVGRDRDFEDAVHANRSALIILENTHGPALRRYWNDLV